MVAAHHTIDLDKFIIQFFEDQNVAADFIERLVEE